MFIVKFIICYLVAADRAEPRRQYVQHDQGSHQLQCNRQAPDRPNCPFHCDFRLHRVLILYGLAATSRYRPPSILISIAVLVPSRLKRSRIGFERSFSQSARHRPYRNPLNGPFGASFNAIAVSLALLKGINPGMPVNDLVGCNELIALEPMPTITSFQLAQLCWRHQSPPATDVRVIGTYISQIIQ